MPAAPCAFCRSHSLAIAAYFWVALPFVHRHGLATGFHQSEQVWYWLFLGNWRQGPGFNDGAGIAHFWSLGVEEQFYVLFSLLVFFIPRRRLVLICSFLAVASLALRVGLGYAGMLSELSARLTPLYLDPLAFGALLACSPRLRAVCSRYAVPIILVGCACYFVRTRFELGITIIGLVAAAAIARGCERPVPLLRLGVLRSLGKYSFAMYVIHDFLSNGFHPIAIRHQRLLFTLSTVVLGTLLSYCLAWLSWHLLEAPALSLKRFFPYCVTAPRALPSAPLQSPGHP